jgi:PhzF family phenazine biosynthesis protein
VKLPLFQVDAFTSRRFGGNPAAVVVLDDWLDDALLQAIAAENNLSETAYVIPAHRPCPLRWFTPALEIDLCGHATLAAAHVLLRHYLPGQSSVTFETRSGMLAVTRDGERLSMDFPARPGRPVPVDDALVAALGVRPREVLLARDLLAVFDAEEAVRAFRPDARRIASIDAFGVIISAPGRDVDFVSRFFAPRAGVLEDPVTGSAHCTLIPYWAERLGKRELGARQVSVRGGELQCALLGDRVTMGGGVVEYLRGGIDV